MIEYGSFNKDGSRSMWVNGKCIGQLMPGASQATLEASPGIQTWSNPRGKVATRMFDADAVRKFGVQWSRNWAMTYPIDNKAALRNAHNDRCDVISIQRRGNKGLEYLLERIDGSGLGRDSS